MDPKTLKLKGVPPFSDCGTELNALFFYRADKKGKLIYIMTKCVLKKSEEAKSKCLFVNSTVNWTKYKHFQSQWGTPISLDPKPFFKDPGNLNRR